MAKQTKVLLADLTYPRSSPSPLSVPYGIGRLAVFLNKMFGDRVQIDLVRTTKSFYEKISGHSYDIFGFSYYVWNARLSELAASHVRALFPRAVIVFGGPHLPIHQALQELCVRSMPHVDFFIEKEGEIALCNLLRSLQENGFNVEDTKKRQLKSVRSVSNGVFLTSPLEERLQDLDGVGSPYCEGLLDEFLEGGFTPIVENNRGCPFSCAYCGKGDKYHNLIAFHSDDYLREEYLYLARKMKSLSHLPFADTLYFADSNTGMYDQDLKICSMLHQLQLQFNWPRHIVTSTGKDLKERALKCIDLLDGALQLTASVQSTDPEVLKNIQRQNISVERILAASMGRGERLKSFSEIILGLPGDSYSKHLQSIADMVNAGINEIRIGQLMILPDTPMADPAYKARFGLKTRFRLLPKGFESIRVGSEMKLAIDFEEICVGTQNMTFEDYKRCRVVGLLINLFFNNVFCPETVAAFKEKGIPLFFYIRIIIDLPKTGFFEALIEEFVSYVHTELFDTVDEVFKFIKRSDVLSRLERKEIGFNPFYRCSEKARGSSDEVLFWARKAAETLGDQTLSKMILRDTEAFYLPK